MRDDDRMLDLPSEFGSGVIGVCDICGTRQAVIVLQKERYKLCVIDFLNKTWVKSEKKPGAPAPLYRSERIWFETESVPGRRAMAIVLSPTKVVRHPTVLITPDVYGLTTTVLDAAIRLAREGFEVLIPDVGKTDGIGPAHHLSLRSGVQFRSGVAIRSKKVADLLALYSDALENLRARDMVDPAKTALFGVSYGATLALLLATRDTRLAAVALAYPYPVSPPDLGRLVTAPVFVVAGSADRAAQRARRQLEAAGRAPGATVEFYDITGARHDFLSRDLSAYDLPRAEEAWARILAFLRERLMPPPPKPPVPPGLKAAEAAVSRPAAPAS
jgi:carboxymethylenebutenolidase